MSLHRALGALALAGLVIAGCGSKTADKGKTDEYFVSIGFTKHQATCITDIIWEKVPKKERNRLTDPKVDPTEEQNAIIGGAMVTCGRDTVIDQTKASLTASRIGITSDQVDCVINRLTDNDLVNFVNGKQDTVAAAITACTGN